MLKNLTQKHLACLKWFDDRKAMEVPWPSPLPDDTFLCTRAKGIYKPKDLCYALSIRQVLNSPYDDREPEVRPDGTWTYRYFQEGPKPEERDRYYTNQALMACLKDGVPVGVLRQTKKKPARYLVLGLAVVQDWNDGYFILEGYKPYGTLTTQADAEDGKFNPKSPEDARQRIETTIVQRRGQPQFRQDLIQAYNSRCAVTGCTVTEALEAAHIMPYMGEQTNVVKNGLLLRADIHTLYDLGLISIEADSMSIVVHTKLAATEYAKLDGKKLFMPQDPANQPSRKALEDRNQSVEPPLLNGIR